MQEVILTIIGIVCYVSFFVLSFWIIKQIVNVQKPRAEEMGVCYALFIVDDYNNQQLVNIYKREEDAKAVGVLWQMNTELETKIREMILR